MTAVNASNFWRAAGLSYLQYLNIASRVTRISLKEPALSRAVARQPMFYNKAVGSCAKAPVTTAIPK